FLFKRPKFLPTIWSLSFLVCTLSYPQLARSWQTFGNSTQGVTKIIARHDQSLIDELKDYLQANPDAVDCEQAYTTIFETTIRHDWFVESEQTASSYLARFSSGAARPLAQIVVVMAKARSCNFSVAVDRFSELLDSLDASEQKQFAVSFAEQLEELA